MFLTREGQWSRDFPIFHEMLQMDPVEGISICLRHGIRNVKFTTRNAETGTQVSLYPFGGDPTVKAFRKQLRKALAQQRRARSEQLAMQARIKMLEQRGVA